jgi:hypothetical protein
MLPEPSPCELTDPEMPDGLACRLAFAARPKGVDFLAPVLAPVQSRGAYLRNRPSRPT